MSKIAVLDIETTALSPAKGCIVEIGFVELDIYTGERKIIYDKLVREPELNNSHANAWIFQNSNLAFNDVMNADPLDFSTVQQILDSYQTTAYNKGFDFRYFKSRDFRVNELDCPMILATNICKIPKKGRAGFKWPSVEEAWKFFFPDSPYIELHRGADDALHEARIVYELYQRGVFKLQDEF